MTSDSSFSSKIKTELQDISKKKILVQEIPGPSVISTLLKPNPTPLERCNRQTCIPCLHGLTNSRCYTSNIGYMIICNRAPCNTSLDMSYNSLQTVNFRKQLDSLKPHQPVPAAYFGESYRSSFSRTLGHWAKYNAPSTKQHHFMWLHTVHSHSSVTGPNRGLNDYKFILTGRFQTNLSREIDEGRRQTVFEDYQNKNKLMVLNSKIDFIQPLRTQLVAINRNINNRPGQTQTDRPCNKRKRPVRQDTDQFISSTPKKKRKIIRRQSSLSPIKEREEGLNNLQLTLSCTEKT